MESVLDSLVADCSSSVVPEPELVFDPEPELVPVLDFDPEPLLAAVVVAEEAAVVVPAAAALVAEPDVPAETVCPWLFTTATAAKSVCTPKAALNASA